MDMTVLEALRQHPEGISLMDLSRATGQSYSEVFNACVVLVGNKLADRRWENGRNLYLPVPQ